MTTQITGSTASEIADSVRSLRDRGALRAGEHLPSVRDLATSLGVNRNTASAAYQQLQAAGIVVSNGRAGTTIAAPTAVPQEGYSPDTVLRDIGSGNPDPRLIPDLTPALASLAGRPVLYGEPVIDTELEALARRACAADLGRHDFEVTVTSGAVDAVERLLSQALTRDDAVALEDPCFLASIQTVRLGGYRGVRVPVDDEGMTVEGLRAALDSGIRALVCTPRAQNPTGASISPRRAAALRELLKDHPYVLIIEDDHYSMLSQHPYESLIGPNHERFALVRSVSKFLGPDLCLAIAATDETTAQRLAMRLSPGTTWVSHLLQRLVVSLVTDPATQKLVKDAGKHYATQNNAFRTLLVERGIEVTSGEGINLWVRLPIPARDAVEHLMRRGWLARTGEGFSLDSSEPSHHLRLTVHELSEGEAIRLADDLASAVTERPTP